MPNQSPSDRTPAPGRPPVFNPGLSAGDPPTTQTNETNPISSPLLLLSSPLLPFSTTPLLPLQCETNPIPARPTTKSKQPTAKKCETNPIPVYPQRPAAPYFSETNPISTTATIPPTKKCKTNPIYPTTTIPPTQKCKTNPIYELRTTNYELFMRNEPNLHPAHDQKCKTNPIPKRPNKG